MAVLTATTEAESRRALLGLLGRWNGSSAGAVTLLARAVGDQGDYEYIGVRGLPADRRALADLEAQLLAICAPACASRAHEVDLASEITKTLAVTVGRDRGGLNDDIALEVMADELGRFPLDCVKRALGSWRRNEKWRPTLADILRDTEWRAKPRRVALEAVRAALGGAS